MSSPQHITMSIPWVQLTSSVRGPVLAVNNEPLQIPIDRPIPPGILLLGTEVRARVAKGLIGHEYKIPHSNSVQQYLLLHSTGPFRIIEAVANIDEYEVPSPEYAQNFQMYPISDPCDINLKDILSVLVSPFIDVLCIFAADLGGLAGTAAYLRSWMLTFANGGTYRTFPCPRLLVVIDQTLLLMGKPTIYDEAIISQIFLDMITANTAHALIPICCTSIRILVLRSPRPRGVAFESIRETVIEEAEVSQRYRLENSFIYSVQHFQTFFQYACKQFVESKRYIDFIMASREKCPVPFSFDNDMKEFLKTIKARSDIETHAIPLVASAIFFQSAPPGMHGMYYSRRSFMTFL